MPFSINPRDHIRKRVVKSARKEAKSVAEDFVVEGVLWLISALTVKAGIRWFSAGARDASADHAEEERVKLRSKIGGKFATNGFCRDSALEQYKCNLLTFHLPVLP